MEPSFNDVRRIALEELSSAYYTPNGEAYDAANFIAQKVAYSGSIHGNRFGKASIEDFIRGCFPGEHFPEVAQKTAIRIADRLLHLGICYCGNRFSGNNLCMLSACQTES